MKILFITSEYPHRDTGGSGGIGTSIKHLASQLTVSGHTVDVLVYGQMVDHVFWDGKICIHQLKNEKFKGISWYLTRIKIQAYINKLIKENGVQIVETSDWTGITAFIKLNAPLVMRLHGSDTYFCHLDNRPVKWWNKFLEKKAYFDADGIIAVSDFVGKMSNKLFNYNRVYEVIYNGINLDLFDTPLKRNDIHSTSVQILYFGTVIRKKGVLEIPGIFNKIVEKYKSVELVIIGTDTPDIKTGEKSTWALMKKMFSHEAYEKTSYIGKVPYEKVKDHIESADICIFPSYAEACPVSWLEAMIMGKVVVASNIGWSIELIENEIDGITEYPSNHEKYAEKILNLLSDPQKRISISTNAVTKVKNRFTSEMTAVETLKYYKSLLEE